MCHWTWTNLLGSGRAVNVHCVAKGVSHCGAGRLKGQCSTNKPCVFLYFSLYQFVCFSWQAFFLLRFTILPLWLAPSLLLSSASKKTTTISFSCFSLSFLFLEDHSVTQLSFRYTKECLFSACTMLSLQLHFASFFFQRQVKFLGWRNCFLSPPITTSRVIL